MINSSLDVWMLSNLLISLCLLILLMLLMLSSLLREMLILKDEMCTVDGKVDEMKSMKRIVVIDCFDRMKEEKL